MCCGTELAQMIQSVLIFREIGCTLTEARHQCNIDFKWNHQKRISETVIHFQVEACEIDGESSSTSEKLKEAKGVKYQGGGGGGGKGREEEKERINSTGGTSSQLYKLICPVLTHSSTCFNGHITSTTPLRPRSDDAQSPPPPGNRRIFTS